MQHGQCGKNLTWTLDDDGTLTISGTGKMDDYYDSAKAIAWFPFRESIEKIIIADGVTTIGKYAFYGCSILMSVTIPDSVTTIGANAFGGCNSLTSVTIPDSVTTIGANAFGRCNSLTSVTIPDSV
ncbi:MAG: leucine-rich repeat domain-containing protein, partial [Selenomonadaceae bacterium]|nr:leucine-rich repeat domain-containing protein [Selenomonadaceae bacterium]